MKRLALTLALSCLLCIPISCSTENTDDATKIATYRNASKTLMGALKSELMAAIKLGGPIKALEVCNTKAPQVTEKTSKKIGFYVTRTSLKPRNVDNAPDDWEKAVLEQFEQRKSQGEDPKTLEFYEQIENQGQKLWRYMKAIPTAEVCLICHGANIAAPVKAKINELYPEDKAIGFHVGDLRGAFSITETVPINSN